jgi:actin related protein 2/3 complex subunit 2
VFLCVFAALFASHVQGDKRDLAVTMIQGFRSYLHYHIKATKSYLHTCMRRRVTSLLQGGYPCSFK